MSKFTLGRVHVPDERDKKFPMSAAIPMSAGDRTYRYWWANGWWGNQGAKPHCVAYSWMHWLEDGPTTHSKTRTAGTGPLFDTTKLYKEAQKIDQWPGENYDGTSVRAGAQMLRSWGVIQSFRWAWDAATVVRALLTTGPVVVGTWWHVDMFQPKLDKETGKILITPSGGKAGGHAYMLNGVNTEKGLVRIKNSWGRCFDDQTEILTQGGWKLVSEVEVGEKVATLHHESHRLEYQTVSETHAYDYEGDLWGYSSAGIDLVVTPNHRLYMKKRGDHPWGLVPAHEIGVKHFHMKKDANWVGDVKTHHRVGEHDIPMSLWVEFLGYFISEGHTGSRTFTREGRYKDSKYERFREAPGRGGDGKFLAGEGPLEEVCSVFWNNPVEETHFRVVITQIKEDHLEKIGACLEKLPFTFTRNESSGKWTCSSKQLWEELSPLGKSFEKYIPQDIKNLDRSYLDILYHALMAGDGAIHAGKNGSLKRTYYTSSKRLADDFQEVLLKTGRCGDIGYLDRCGRDNGTGGITRHIEWYVKIKEKSLTPSPGCGFEPERIPYEGMVYCVTVPNHIIYVRRNGKACWSGNSWGDRGFAWMRIEDLNTLIGDHGEACLAIEVET